MLLHRFVTRFLQCERRVRQIYLQLSAHDAFPPAMRAFWQTMAEEENQHRAFLEHTAGFLNFVEASFEAPEDLLERIEANLNSVEKEVAKSALGADDALRHALSLEGAEHRQLDNIWLQGFACAAEMLLHTEKPDEVSHLRRLIDAVYAFSTDEELHTQAAALWSTVQSMPGNRVASV